MNNYRKLFLTSIIGLAVLGFYACGNAENGQNGKDGRDGSSCTVTANKDGTATISCPDGTSFNIKNGEDGQKGDAGSDGKTGDNAENGKGCRLVTNMDNSLAVVCEADGSSFVVRGNSDNYTNYCKDGYFGPDCLPCTCKNGTCNDSIRGDGKCISCYDGWSGDNCDKKVPCPHGTALEGEPDSGECASCNNGWTGDSCTEIAAGFGSVTDTDNKTYSTVIIKGHEWYAENSRYQGRDVFCNANIDEDAGFIQKFGCLYNLADAKKVCPPGWHLPTENDFEELLYYIFIEGVTSSFLSLIAQSPSWTDYSNEGSNDFGFGALPAGRGSENYWNNSVYYNYYDFGSLAIFWSSYNGGKCLFLGDTRGDTSLSDLMDEESDIFASVRCLKD